MLKHLGKWTTNPSLFPQHFTTFSCSSSAIVDTLPISMFPFSGPLKIRDRHVYNSPCRARRRVLYESEDNEEDYEYNQEIAMLEMYTQTMKDEVLLVRVMVDEEQAEILIFKGFSSCLSYSTSSDPSRSVVPAKAVIESIDIVNGPFDPSNIHYIEKGLTFDAFKNRINCKNI